MMENTTPIFKFAIRQDLEDTGDLFLPKQGEPTATGYDVRAAPLDRKDIVIKPGAYFKIPLGFRSFCPAGWYLFLHPRSSSFVKKHLHTLIGVLDQEWEGENIFAGQYLPDTNTLSIGDLVIKFGEAIGQLIPCRRQEMSVSSVSNNEYIELCKNRNGLRGDHGFGSTDLTNQTQMLVKRR